MLEKSIASRMSRIWRSCFTLHTRGGQTKLISTKIFVNTLEGLACDPALFGFVKEIFSPCNACIERCSVCRPCIHCIDHPEGEGCDQCKQCEPCIGCAACLTADCPMYNKCQDCTLCIPCLKNPTLPGCDKCGPCKPCIKSIGCFHDQTEYAKYIFGTD